MSYHVLLTALLYKRERNQLSAQRIVRNDLYPATSAFSEFVCFRLYNLKQAETTQQAAVFLTTQDNLTSFCMYGVR